MFYVKIYILHSASKAKIYLKKLHSNQKATFSNKNYIPPHKLHSTLRATFHLKAINKCYTLRATFHLNIYILPLKLLTPRGYEWLAGFRFTLRGDWLSGAEYQTVEDFEKFE